MSRLLRRAWCAALFFVAGALFCRYVVIKTLANYMLGFSDAATAPMLAMGQYLDLIRDLMLAFGAVFELPLLILFLSLIGMVTHRGLWKFNRWFVVIAFTVGAILTPTPDVPTQLTMAVPMVLLYNLSIVASYIVLSGSSTLTANGCAPYGTLAYDSLPAVTQTTYAPTLVQ